jgi:hypothetical protein
LNRSVVRAFGFLETSPANSLFWIYARVSFSGTFFPCCPLNSTIGYSSNTKTGGKNVKKIAGIAILLLVFASMICGIAAAAISVGPAPNSGDGVSDGSGLDAPFGQNADPGAPNSGDGIPDGSGFV